MEEPSDPLALFTAWFDQAQSNELNDPNAMFVATVDETGLPNVRVVLMKGYDEAGFVFYTNLESAKGTELTTLGAAAFCFDWKSVKKRVVVRGDVRTVSDAEADIYYQSRARQSRLGAWASKQSRPLKSKTDLIKEVAKFALKFGVGHIPRPPFWTGFRLDPQFIEFHDGSNNPESTLVRFSRDSKKCWSVENVHETSPDILAL